MGNEGALDSFFVFFAGAPGDLRDSLHPAPKTINAIHARIDAGKRKLTVDSPALREHLSLRYWRGSIQLPWQKGSWLYHVHCGDNVQLPKDRSVPRLAKGQPLFAHIQPQVSDFDSMASAPETVANSLSVPLALTRSLSAGSFQLDRDRESESQSGPTLAKHPHRREFDLIEAEENGEHSANFEYERNDRASPS